MDNEKQGPFLTVWVFDCDYQHALLILISLNKHETSLILKFCKQIWEVEREALLWSAPGGT